MGPFRLLAALALMGASLPVSAEMVMFSQRNFQGSSYALKAASTNLSFSPRSVRVLPEQPWQLCPRPFFGGSCITVAEANPQLNLPRGFSGMVRSARPAAEVPAGEDKSGKPEAQPETAPEP